MALQNLDVYGSAWKQAMWPEPNLAFVSSAKIPDEYTQAWYFLVQGNRLAVHFDAEQSWRPLSEDEVEIFAAGELGRHFLGYLGDVACFVIEVGDIPGVEFSGLRSLFGRIDNMMTDLAGRALQVSDWYKNHQYCGKCGAQTQMHDNDRAMVCRDCNIFSYPRLSPSIIVLVHRGREVLLARNHRFPDGMYSTLAGFVEPGESIEQTLVREVKEEVGVNVHKLEYLGSQPWPFPNSLMLGFHVEYESGDIVLQEEEIADAGWYACDDLPNIPGKTAIARWLIDDYLAKCGIDPD